MLSLTLLTMVTMIVLPMLISISQERLTIRQQEEVTFYLERQIHHYLLNESIESFPFSDANISERLLEGELYQLCVTWIGANQRKYERCHYAKK